MSAVAGEQAAQALGAARIALGVGSWLLPGVLARVLGAPIRRHPPLPFVTRAFGARDVALGVGLLAADTPAERNRWLVLGMAVDAADAAAGVLAGLRRQVPRTSAALLTVTPLAAVWVASQARSNGAGQAR